MNIKDLRKAVEDYNKAKETIIEALEFYHNKVLGNSGWNTSPDYLNARIGSDNPGYFKEAREVLNVETLDSGDDEDYYSLDMRWLADNGPKKLKEYNAAVMKDRKEYEKIEQKKSQKTAEKMEREEYLRLKKKFEKYK